MSAATEALEGPEPYRQWVTCSHYWMNVAGECLLCGVKAATAASDLEQCPGCMGDTGDGGTVLRALGRVLGDLSDLGYDTQWRGLRAADVGACHGRFRVFILAAHRNGIGYERPGDARGRWPRFANGRLTPANPQGRGCGLCKPDDQRPPCGAVDTPRDNSFAAIREVGAPTHWGDYEPGTRRWEAAMGRRAPAPTERTGRGGGHRLSPRFTEWMMGLPEGWVTDPAIGLSSRDQVKACGNGVVPQQAMAALRDMLAAFQAAEVAA